MKNKKAALGVLALIAIVIASILITAPKPAANTSGDILAKSAEEADHAHTPAAAKPMAAVVESPLLANAPLKSDFVMGDKSAPVTLVEYASLSCPHCADFHNHVLPGLIENYISKGKLMYILRQFPLNESAFAGAMLVQCVGEQGGPERYYTFNRVLFDSQSKWAFDANFKSSLKTFAEVGGVDAATFDACLNDPAREKFLLQVRKDAGETLKINSTPYIFLNGHPHQGSKKVEEVSAEIDALLASATSDE